MELRRRLPGQRKTQREALALLVATMLDVRSAKLMELAAALPRAAERIDIRYQWIVRVLANPHIDCDAVMAPFAQEVLARASERVELILARASCPTGIKSSCWPCASASGRCRWRGASRRPQGRSTGPSSGSCSTWSRPGCPRMPR